MIRKEFQPTALRNLLASHPFPTVGEISFASTRDANWNDPSLSREDQTRQDSLLSLWEKYDSAFKDRDDYRVWRTLFRPFVPSELSKTWTDPLGSALNGLQNPEPIIVWGILSILPQIISGRYNKGHDMERIIVLAEESDARIFNSLKPIEGAQAGCGLVRVLALDGILMARLRGYGSLTCDQVDLHFKRLKKYLKELDRNWVLGRSVSLRAVRRERQTGRTVAAFSDIKMLLGITRALSNHRRAALSAIEEINDDTEGLLRQGTILAISAWRSARSLRRFEEDWRAHNNPIYTSISMEALVKREMQALLNVSLAARDSGLYLLSAAMGHLYLRVVPEGLITNAKSIRTIHALLYTIESAGLELDYRFKQPFAPRTDNRPQEPIEEQVSEAVREPKSRRSIEQNPQTDTSRILRLRLTKDIVTDSRWQTLISICRRGLELQSHHTPLLLLSEFTGRARELDNKEALRCAFNLFLKYGQIGGAAKLMRSFDLEKEDVLHFARSMKNALRIMPFGMNVKKHSEWQGLLRRSWTSLPDVDRAMPEEVSLIHEVLLGQYLSIVRNAGSREARVFVEKYYGLLSPSEIKDTIENNINMTLSAGGAINKRRFQEFLQQISGSSLSFPVCVSVVSTDRENWSVLATDAFGHWRCKRVRIHGVLEMAKNIQTTHKLWFRGIDNQSAVLGLPWGRELTQLAKAIATSVESLQPRCSWLMLAVEPELATLPWQDLMSRGRLKNMVVSLVPSFSWASTVHEHNVSERRGMHLMLSNDPDLASLRKDIRRREGMLPGHLLSTTIVLGHGSWTEGSIPSVIAKSSRALDLRDWMNLIDYRLAVVHSCYGGKVEHKFLGDMGGLPGLALSFNCRLFCAPVSEVPVNTARTLHRHLFQTAGPREFGLRYLAAVREDPAVALYNLYGLANEPVSQSRGRNGKEVGAKLSTKGSRVRGHSFR